MKTIGMEERAAHEARRTLAVDNGRGPVGLAHNPTKYGSAATIDAMRQSAFGARMEYLGSAEEIDEAFAFAPADASEPYYASLTGLILATVTGLARGRGPIPVLDVGAGVGRVAGDLARSEWVETVFAVEQSPELVRELEVVASGVHRTVSVPVTSTKTLSAVLRPPGPARKLKAVHGDAHDLPFPDASFPCALALGLLDRVEGPRAVADELARVLEPGGIAVVSCLHDFAGGPADAREWAGATAELFACDEWASGRPRNQRLDLRQNARYVERFNAEIVVVLRNGRRGSAPSPAPPFRLAPTDEG